MTLVRIVAASSEMPFHLRVSTPLHNLVLYGLLCCQESPHLSGGRSLTVSIRLYQESSASSVACFGHSLSQHCWSALAPFYREREFLTMTVSGSGRRHMRLLPRSIPESSASVN